MTIGSCKNCVFCKTLYIPPAKCYEEVTKVVGGSKHSLVCTAFENEAGYVQFLGDDGFCEIYTPKEVANANT